MRLAVLLPALLGTAFPALAGPPDGADPVTVHVFYDDRIHFTPDDPARWDTPTVRATEDGREINRTVLLEPPAGRNRILARVTLRPIPKDIKTVHDPWDRAGSVQLLTAGGVPVEVVKFITAYGGRTEHVVDVSHLAPLLRGECAFRGFVDTWLSPAWKMDFDLTFEPLVAEETPEWAEGWTDEHDDRAADWVRPVFHEPEMTRELLAAGARTVTVEIPEGTGHAVLHYLVSGHCTDGRGADEFVSKDNVVTVDGNEVVRFRPWRADCRNFRDVNPYCRRWFDGSWSADFDRSGWCPGDAVAPEIFDLTESLSPGSHVLGFDVEDVRPKDDSGHGYWRVSAYVVGWNE